MNGTLSIQDPFWEAVHEQQMIFKVENWSTGRLQEELKLAKSFNSKRDDKFLTACYYELKSRKRAEE